MEDIGVSGNFSFKDSDDVISMTYIDGHAYAITVDSTANIPYRWDATKATWVKDANYAWDEDADPPALVWNGVRAWWDRPDEPLPSFSRREPHHKTLSHCDYCSNRLLDEDRKCIYCGAPR